jgi:asparagine synthase (glutamine-hydrolysing)
LGLITPLLPNQFEKTFLGDRLHQIAEILGVESPEAMYVSLVSHWKESESPVLRSSELPTVLSEPSTVGQLPDFTQRMLFLDTVTYLPMIF